MAMMPNDEFAVAQDNRPLGAPMGEADTTRGSARPAVGAWAAGWVGTVVVAVAWLVSLSFGDTGDTGDTGDESLLSSIFLAATLVTLYSTIPALVGLLLLLAPAVVGYRRTVPDWVVVVVATVVGGVSGEMLDLSIRAGAVSALIGSIAGIALLRARSTSLRWTVFVVALGGVLTFGQFLPIL